MALLFALLPALAVSSVLLAFEWRLGGARQDWVLNLQAWAAQLAAALILLPLMPHWHGVGLLDGAKLPFWLGFAVLFLIRDLGEYLYHRAQHRVPFLWAMHALHHSDPNMAALTTQRHFWGDQLVKELTIWSAALMVIDPAPAMGFAYGIASLWNFLTHSDLPIDLGRWSWVINTPAYHRRHHSALPEHYDSNFAAMLPVFDVLCGSYNRPDGHPPTGLDRAPRNLGEVLIWPLIWNRARLKPATTAAPA